MEELTLLILGAGWTSTFLIPHLQSHNIPFAATTTSGHPVADHPTIPFKFDPSAPAEETHSAIAALPRARYILITFPLTGTGPSKLLVETYTATHRSAAASSPNPDSEPRFIQLGSSGIWQQQQQQQQPSTESSSPGQSRSEDPWLTRHSPYATTNPRAVAEDELLALSGCVLNLSGLWGGARQPRNWGGRVAATKEAVRGKKSLHLIHGEDIARAIAAIVQSGDGAWAAKGRAAVDGDGRFVYDWWALLAGWRMRGRGR
ncbi:hypothetical protein NEMBOFW57_004169 [Staphylotrichum longicolle]|uniref:Uncharacterized protein n=1 Tax=Staphylotrichum longicolle TaxID=669026 RepID=A0AAD4I5D1_9PEZI|nr:hypothetical protein NEMBOFW57_004169 [Staphylotrichum longicolle]